MTFQIIKCAPDVDLYLEWSSVVEAPSAVGSRADMHTYLSGGRPPGHADRTLAAADKYGSSAWIRGCGWSADGERYRNGGLLPRARMAEYARRLMADPDAEPDGLLEPIDYGSD